jgi:hypothetical protein
LYKGMTTLNFIIVLVKLLAYVLSFLSKKLFFYTGFQHYM